MSERKLLVLVDGSSYLYRAFHALPNLTTSSGDHTGAVYGVINMIRKLIADHKPDYMAVVFDAKGKTFRHELYPEYKANRPPMPRELRTQIEPLHDIIRALGLPLISVPGVEADDVIATLAKCSEGASWDTLVSTGDKDLAQIVNPHVTLVDTMQDRHLDEQGVRDKFGVEPASIVDYLTLIGDKSDNVPGVPKVGPKTAVKWLDAYGGVEEICARAGEIKGKVGENLRASIDQLPASKALVTVRDDVELPVSIEELEIQAEDGEKLRELFTNLEFSSWLSELGGSAAARDDVSTDYRCITTTEALSDCLQSLGSAELIALDTETTSLDAMCADLVGLSFSIREGHAVYIPLGHQYQGVPPQLDREQVLSELKPLLENPTRPKVGQNLKYDKTVLNAYGIELRGITFDTMLESYVLDSVANRHDMDTLSLKYLGHKTVSYEEVAGKGKSQIPFSEVPLDQATAYACEDADIALRLHNKLWPRLDSQARLKDLFEKIEMPLIAVLSQVERNGVAIDGAMLSAHSKQLANEMESLEDRAHQLAGTEFNIGSPRQIQEVLYDQQNLPVLRKTPKGQPSTAEDVLQELAIEYELPQVILEHRALSKLRSTYTEKLPDLINPRTGRVHTSYHQAVAATGRLSSTDPNLQNIPVRTEQGRRIREAFVAESGHLLLAADYSQIELRIMAHLSQDQGLLAAFARGDDIHRATAAEIFDVAGQDVTPDQRRNAKAINFGLIYGMSAFGLSKQLRIPRHDAQEYIDLYFARYPGVKGFMDNTRTAARERGYVETVFGRRLYLPDIRSSNYNRRQYAERTAINAPMQGTAADIIKMAMIVIHDWIEEQQPEVKMIMQVHDELVFEIPEALVERASSEITRMMSAVARLDVPMEAGVGQGHNWMAAHA